MDKQSLTPSALLSYVFLGLVLLGLFLTARYNYLLFQTIAGIFRVVIAIGVFAIAWNSRRFQENNYLLFLGIAYLFVGTLDLLYTLAYQETGLFPGFSPHLPAHIWFTARFLESISLFLAPQFIGRRLQPSLVFSGYVFTLITIILVIFLWPLSLQDLVASGPVLTALQKTGNYVNGVILLGALALLWRQRREFDPGVLRLLMGAIALAVGSEMALTPVAGMSTQADLLCQLLKIASFYLIYRALIATELIKPYVRMVQNLRVSEDIVRHEKNFADRLMEMTQVIVLVLDGEGRILRLNNACETITGYTLADAKNRPFWEVFPAPEEVTEVQEAFSDLISGDFSQTLQFDWVAKNGDRRLIAWSNTAFPGEDGSVEYVIGTGIDISEQREVERRFQRLNSQLERQIQEVPELTDKLEITDQDMENLTDAVIRDFRVPIRWLRGYCRALEEHSAQRPDAKGAEYLKRMQGVIRQMAEFIEALLQFDRLAQAEIHRQEIDLSDQARLIIENLKRTDPAREMEFNIEPGLTAVGDPSMLRSALKNLLGNAWKSTEEVPRGRIEFGALPQKNSGKGFFVRDNRTDFGRNYAHKLFRSFQRFHTTRDFSGPDISLTTVRTIILRHGGRIWADGEVGKGITFYFTLPNSTPEIAQETIKEDQPN